jgi:heme-binding uptake protein ChaN (Tiki superfamily)
VERLKKEIFGVDPNSARKYIQEFHRDFQRFEEISSFDDLVLASSKSDIVYVGDYHALPSAQAFEARLLRELASRSPSLALCLEMVYGHQQRFLDRFMSGAMPEDEFLRRIRYDLEWGYDWQSFRPLFEVAREYSLPVFGIDCEPRHGFRHIRKRDAYAASRIADIVEKHPGTRLMVIVGESHLGRSHLPGRVEQLLQRKRRECRSLLVVQNLEAIYWQLLEQGQHQREVVRVSRDSYCVFNASPLEKYESYRQVLDRWKGEQDEDTEVDLTPTVYNIIDTILDFLGVNKYTTCLRREGQCSEYLVDVFPEVYGPAEATAFRRILRGAQLDNEEVDEILEHVRRKGSCFVPRLDAIFLGQFDLAHGGEEAAHFVNLCLKRELNEEAPTQLPQHDLFYGRVLEEALAFFGSKLIVPGRNHFFEAKFYQYYRKSPELIEANTPYSYEEFKEIIDFILLHKKFETHYTEYEEVPQEILRGIRSEPKRMNVLVHELGYFLGQQIYDGYHAGAITRREISDLFKKKFVDTGSALRAYLDLVEKLSGVPA